MIGFIENILVVPALIFLAAWAIVKAFGFEKGVIYTIIMVGFRIYEAIQKCN